MTATDARHQLQRLQVERLDAVDAGLGSNELYMEDLESDIAASRDASTRARWNSSRVRSVMWTVTETSGAAPCAVSSRRCRTS